MAKTNLKQRKSILAACNLVIVAVIVAALVLAWLASGRDLVPGVTTRALGPCAVDWHAQYGALVLACPRHEKTRLWPLPMIYPWFEHGDPRERAA